MILPRAKCANVAANLDMIVFTICHWPKVERYTKDFRQSVLRMAALTTVKSLLSINHSLSYSGEAFREDVRRNGGVVLALCLRS